MKTKKAKAHWALQEAKEKGSDVCDVGHAKKDPNEHPKQGWTFGQVHLKSPTAALASVLEGLEQGDERAL